MDAAESEIGPLVGEPESIYMKISHKLPTPLWLAILITGCITPFFFHVMEKRAQQTVFLELDIVSKTPGFLQLYFDRGAGFHEADSIRKPYHATSERRGIRFPLRRGEFEGFRLDPGDHAGDYLVSGVRFTDRFGKTLWKPGLESVRPHHASIEKAEPGIKNVWSIQAYDFDPQLHLTPPHLLKSERAWGLAYSLLLTGLAAAFFFLALLSIFLVAQRFFGGRGAAYECLYIAGLLSSCMMALVPWVPRFSGAGLDDSWALGLLQAAAEGMRWGQEIVFTFGPYSGVWTNQYHPDLDSLGLSISIGFAVFLALVLFANTRDSGLWVKLVVLLVLPTGIIATDGIILGTLFLVGFSYARTLLSENHPLYVDRSSRKQVWVLFGFPMIGLLPLIKGSALPLGLGVLFLCCLGALTQGRTRDLWMFPVMVSVSLTGFWLLSGQMIGDLPAYVMGLVHLTIGYSGAMALTIPGTLTEVVLFILIAAWMGIHIASASKEKLLSRMILLALFGMFLFITFKAGFVRHDAHNLTAASGLLIAGFFLNLLAFKRTGSAILLSAFAAWIVLDSSFRNSSTGDLYNRFLRTVEHSFTGLEKRITDPRMNDFLYEVRLGRLQDAGQLPLLKGSVDLYSYDQAYLVASGNDWRPRPVIQSYSAYTPWLAERNRAHLEDARAPDYIFFRVATIDHRYPSLDDGSSWPVIIENYSFVDQHANHLLFSRREEKWPLILARESRNRSARLGEEYQLPTQGIVFLRLNLVNSLSGRLMSILYKVSIPTITITLSDGSERSFRLPSKMASAGWVVSPFVYDSGDFVRLMENTTEELRMVEVFRIEVPERERFFWKDSFDLEYLVLQREAQ